MTKRTKIFHFSFFLNCPSHTYLTVWRLLHLWMPFLRIVITFLSKCIDASITVMCCNLPVSKYQHPVSYLEFFLCNDLFYRPFYFLSFFQILKWPRPKSPPVVPLEPRYFKEYGMPSTHAMVGTLIPFSILFLTMGKVQVSLAWKRRPGKIG